MFLKIVPLNDNVKVMYSTHGTFNQGDCGLDLFCPETITINPGESVCIDLQIKCEALKEIGSNDNVSYYMYPRSSMGSRTPLRLSNSVGIIDAGYRGNLCAYVDNIKTQPYTINSGDRLFQICAPNLEPIQFSIVNQLSDTQRGEGGFGSTGRWI